MSQPDHNIEGHKIKMEGHEAMTKDEKQDIIPSEESAQTQDDDNASGFETRAQRMQHMPKVISLQIPPNGSDHQGGPDFWYCPQNECRETFSNAKDRNDHAHWNHAWCWKCSIEFKTQKALQLSCVPSCSGKFEKSSELLAHLEDQECTAAATKGVHEHGIAHLILLDYARDFTNEEKIYLASLEMKAIVLPKETIWLVDPLGKFFDVITNSNKMKKISAQSHFIYTWKIQGDDFDDISGDSKYTCLACGEKFVRPRNFHDHIRGVEKKKKKRASTANVEVTQAALTVWKCEGCEAIFKVLSGLTGHYEGGCKKIAEEMRALRKEKEHWNDLDEAMRKEMEEDGDGEVVVLDYKELTSVTYEDGSDYEDDAQNEDEKWTIKWDPNESEDEELSDLVGLKEETGNSVASSEDSKGEYTGGKPVGLENLITSMGIVPAEESSDEEEDWSD
ncbi:hypothetical protein TWF106_003856 [Orbilia oligospora]|uniref:C2H2-type domain-containing protein n=1 Tax=Orbilia oligospora TaxID=2813651 RepID=A0A7C8UQ71_ORBOL|nr:hypothetical protein TWF106_003856 [Orbilia oligospora]